MSETRYARNGDVSIAYQVVDGPGRDVLVVPSIVSQMEHLWEEPRVVRLLRRLARFSRLILFDRRGSGMSDRTEPPPLEQQMDDVRAVMRAAGSDSAALIAETEGTTLATLFAATYPDVSRTVTDLVAGSGLTFSERGTHELKGVPGEWQLFAASG